MCIWSRGKGLQGFWGMKEHDISQEQIGFQRNGLVTWDLGQRSILILQTESEPEEQDCQETRFLTCWGVRDRHVFPKIDSLQWRYGLDDAGLSSSPEGHIHCTKMLHVKVRPVYQRCEQNTRLFSQNHQRPSLLGIGIQMRSLMTRKSSIKIHCICSCLPYHPPLSHVSGPWLPHTIRRYMWRCTQACMYVSS